MCQLFWGGHWALQMLAKLVTLPWEVAGSGESIFVFVVGEIRFTHATGDHEEQPLRILMLMVNNLKP